MKHLAKSAADPMVENRPFAPIELLDPQPPAASTERGLHRERVLGLLLVLVIAGLSLWQVATATQRFNAYQRGIQAGAVQDWATAQRAYQAAGGYGDAEQRAAAADRLVAEVRALEVQAVAAESRCDATRLAATLSSLQQIAPRGAVTDRVSRELASAPNWLLWCRARSEPADHPAPYPLLLAYPTLCATSDRFDCNH